MRMRRISIRPPKRPNEMSVAFRRDGDEEHLEPKFEIPIPVGPNLVTARGLALIQAKVAELEAALPAIEGDAEVQSAKRLLRYWRTRQATAQLMPPASGETVAFGSSIVFRQGGRERHVTIVGDDEADPPAGLLSFSAPLSRAMMDAEPGDVVAFGGDESAIEILSVTGSVNAAS